MRIGSRKVTSAPLMLLKPSCGMLSSHISKLGQGISSLVTYVKFDCHSFSGILQCNVHVCQQVGLHCSLAQLRRSDVSWCPELHGFTCLDVET
jgi:hypothetical protein